MGQVSFALVTPNVSPQMFQNYTIFEITFDPAESDEALFENCRELLIFEVLILIDRGERPLLADIFVLERPHKERKRLLFRHLPPRQHRAKRGA